MARRKYHSELREQQARDTRRRILEGAGRITVLDMRLLSHTAVARAAGVAERTVYRHFPTSAALHEAFAEFQNERFGPELAADFEVSDLPAMFERWPERIAGSGAVEALIDLTEPEILVKARGRRYARLDRAVARLVPKATRTQRRQLTLVFGALISGDLFKRGKQYLHLDPKDVVPGPAWALRVLIDTLNKGDTPWKRS
jgi:AcrR family transcriptional regulator